MRGLVAIIVAALLLPVVAVLVFHKVINSFHAETEGVWAALALIIASYIGIAEFFYLKSERFYLWVHRQILRWRRVHTFWKFTVYYCGIDSLFAEGRSRVPELQTQIQAAFTTTFPGKPLTETRLQNALSITVDDVDRFDFSFDVERNEVSLQTSKMRVPGHIYWTFLDSLIDLLDRTEKAIRPHETRYGLELTFERNPYFGFFVRHVPEKLLNYFKCSFQSSINAECRVEATKDAIYLSCPSNATLSQVTRGYLSLSDRMITQGKAT